jgi:hypothetical protein
MVLRPAFEPEFYELPSSPTLHSRQSLGSDSPSGT